MRQPGSRLGRTVLLGAAACLLGTGLAGAQLTLTWQDNSGDETGFKIERAAAGGSFAELVSVPANTTRFTDTSVASGTAYTYRVRAYNAAGHSAYSNAVVQAVPMPVNAMPTISAIADQKISLGSALGALAFTIADAETPAGNLVVSSSSSNLLLVPKANVVLGGSGANRTVTIKPVSGQAGTSTITVAVSDGTDTSTQTFTVTVVAASAPVNKAPTITPIGSRTVPGRATGDVPFTVGDDQTSPRNLKVTGSSSNTALVPNTAIEFGGSGAERTVKVTPLPGKTGSTTITVAVSDGALTTKTSYVVKVTTGNTSPTVSKISDQSVALGKTTSTLRFTVDDDQTAASQLKVTASSSNPALVPTTSIVFGGSGDSRTVKITPKSGRTGTALITLTVSDGSLTARETFNVKVVRTSSASALAPVATSGLVNASLRALVPAGGQPLIAGFAVSGSAEKPLLLRAVGPALAGFGVTNALADPNLSVYADQMLVAANDNWGSDDAAALAQTGERVGAFALPAGSKDAALAATFGAGVHTVHVTSPEPAGGVALIELYDDSGTGESAITNLSGRGQVGAGENVLILGFEIAGETAREVLLRGVGPSLAAHGVSGVLADPRLELHHGDAVLVQNDDWAGTPALAEVFAAAGAFALTSPSTKDAAFVVRLEPGVYTVVLAGVNGATGVALLELYDLGASVEETSAAQ